MRKPLVAIVFLLTTLAQCKEDPREKFKDPSKELNEKEVLINLQKAEVKRDSIFIERLIKENQWGLKSTGTGLRYEITHSTELEPIVSGSRVFLEYLMTDLKGDTLYTSDKSGYMDVTVDFSHAESGIHELLRNMNYGESARAIIPFHLAHGFAGDDYKITPFTSLIVNLKVLI